MKQVTHETEDLIITMREKLGMDELDSPLLFFILREHLKKQTGLGDNLAPLLWTRITFVIEVIQQTVSVAGKGRFDIPNVYATEDEIADFYDFMMGRSTEVIKAFQETLKKVAPKSVPNQDGAKKEPVSDNAPKPDSLQTAVA